jgi:hypothetical protein
MASDPREAYQRLIQELQHRARQGGVGGSLPSLPRGFKSGGGILFGILAGGALLASSLYNGKWIIFAFQSFYLNFSGSGWWS